MDKGIQGWQNVQLLKWARAGAPAVLVDPVGLPRREGRLVRGHGQWLPALAHLPRLAATPRVRYDR
jgi:hypothetical protein